MLTTILLATLAIFVVWAITIFNRLVALRNRFTNAFAQIEVQLKRRHDLIPNLVESVKGYLDFERGTLEAVINARNTAQHELAAAARNPRDPGAMQALGGAEGALGAALVRLNALVEAYPDLKGNEQVAGLQEELTSTENRVAFARQAYNDQVTEYNTYRQSFPQVTLAGAFGHGQDAPLLQIPDTAAIQEPPRVSFS